MCCVINNTKKKGFNMDVSVGDILTVKKNHPCGDNRFLVTRVGADFKIRCMTCNHEIMLPRQKIEKNIKSIEKKEQKYV